MKRVILIAVAVTIIIVVVATGFAYYEYTYHSPGGKYALAGTFYVQGNKSAVIFPSGTTIVVNSTDVGSPDGPMVTSTSPIHHSIFYNIEVKGYYLFTGSWQSSGESFLYIYSSSTPTVTMEPPYPFENHGTIDQTLPTGNYTVWIGGYVGDRISITRGWKLEPSSSHQVGSFYVPAGSVVEGLKTYSFYLNESASLAGSFTVGGSYLFSINSSSGSSSSGSYNSSLRPSLFSFNLTGTDYAFQLDPGHCDVTFAEGTFYINQTLELVYYFDNST